MNEKIRALLISLLTSKFAGVRKDGLEQLARVFALQATSEEEAVALVEKLTEAQVDDFVKEYRSHVDRETTHARKTFEENLKKKFDLIEKKKSPTTERQAEDTEDVNGNENDLARIISNAVANAVKPLQERLEAYERGDIAKSRLQAVSEKLNACKDEVFKTKVLKDFNRMRFDTDEAFAEYLTDTEKDIQHANQRLADTNLTGHGKPMFAQKNESGISTGVAQFVEAQTKGAASLGGKEV